MTAMAARTTTNAQEGQPLLLLASPMGTFSESNGMDFTSFYSDPRKIEKDVPNSRPREEDNGTSGDDESSIKIGLSSTMPHASPSSLDKLGSVTDLNCVNEGQGSLGMRCPTSVCWRNSGEFSPTTDLKVPYHVNALHGRPERLDQIPQPPRYLNQPLDAPVLQMGPQNHKLGTVLNKSGCSVDLCLLPNEYCYTGAPSASIDGQLECFWKLRPRGLNCFSRDQLGDLFSSRFLVSKSLDGSAIPSMDEGSNTDDKEDDNNEDDNNVENEEDDDDDVFPELPSYREFLLSRCMSRSRYKWSKIARRLDVAHISCDPTSCGWSDEEAVNSEEIQPVRSPWSQSMSQLMQKLDQLNLDIQEALSTNSSPTSTPTSAQRSEVAVRMSQAEAEIEAKEACDWLRAAGFPQYAHLYEDSQLPIDISSVKRDHDFLDKDLVEPLCRRLNTLNKCASMKLDVSLPKKKSEDSDEEDQLAISNRWTFEWSSRRWSRLQDIDCILEGEEGACPRGLEAELQGAGSRESVLTDLSEPEVSSLHSGSSGGSRSGDLATLRPARSASASIMPDPSSLAPSPMSDDRLRYSSLPSKSSRHGRTRAKDFLRRMETLRSRRSSSGKAARKTLTISGPVLQYEPESLRALQCVEIANGDVAAPEVNGSSGLHSQSSSSTSSTPSLKPQRALHKRSGVYLEDLDVLAGAPVRKTAEQGRRSECRSYEDLVVHVPKDHKPGTFPKALSVESLTPTPGTAMSSGWRPDVRQHRDLAPISRLCPRGSRASVYDNVPSSHLYASTGDLMDLEKEDLFPQLDDILQHVNGLQRLVNNWSRSVLPDGEARRNSASQVTLDGEGSSALEGRTTPSDLDRDAISLNDTDSSGTRERRDSGVGASLTRPSRLRWPSFRISCHLGQSGASLQINSQSVGQLCLLQKFSLLRLTAIMEKYSMSNKHGWTWSVPKFMKRMKVPDYKDKIVFGVPLIIHVQRSGQPLPVSLQQALHYLRSQCLDQVGLFRKSGVKSRIQALRQMNESSPEHVDYEEQSAYDVADMLKQFFRDLPEPLLTSKLGETFLHIYQYVPKEQRLQAVQAAIMLMSDENREVLQALLCFLSDVTSSVGENQMTPMNIAVCLAPSLFHLNILKKDNLSPRAMQKKYATGRPDQKDLNENMAATQGLAHMITECVRLFEVPHEMVAQSRNSYVEAEMPLPTVEELCGPREGSEACCQGRMEILLQELLREARDRSKVWVSCPSSDGTELSYRKVGDGNPLRRWRVMVEVEAPPSVVLNRVLRERHLWDMDFLQWKVRETLDRQTEVFQYAINSMPPHPSRDFVVLRSWRTGMPKGACALVSMSVDLEDCPAMGGVRCVILDSHFLLEPCGTGKSRLTHICRVDLKGRSPEWYNKAFGYLCAADAARLRNSFQPLDSDGPETKI
ncbi:stAR-related lipid transfer protein 13 isoform X1 [Paramormyrops kingsleyae]|uniref:stAR-related lipid transfer protein 13 isoform X1 n=1 Tax=Paramormyrops kingsleyae TaxID=1676925 RepID=UPI003B96CF34